MKRTELTRRKFIRYGSTVVLGAPVIMNTQKETGKKRKSGLRCVDLHNHFKSTETAKIVKWDKSTDKFTFGDPLKPVRKVAVAWKARWDTLKEAESRGADLFISHESICVHAQNSYQGTEEIFALPSELGKFRWLKETGLVVYRCHDIWDRFPGTGIRDTWRKRLTIGDNIYHDEYPFYITEVDPMTLGDLSRHILEQVKPLGQNGVMVSGDINRIIRRIGTGTGQNTNSAKLKELGADVGIMSDDGYLHVRMGAHAHELDFPTIIVNHGVSEEWGIMNLAAYIQNVFPELEVFHIPQFCPYQVIT